MNNIKMLKNDFFKDLKGYIFDLLKESLPQGAVCHNFNHSLFVVKAANKIAEAEKISEDELEILLTAAWFHDTGYIHATESHEEKSKEIAEKYLNKKEFSKDKIIQVLDLIDATVMPQTPKNKLEEIICDADLYHLGGEDFSKKTNLLRSELEQLCNETYTDLDWLKKNDSFIAEHSYFTDYAFERLNEQKTLNKLQIKKGIRKLIEKKEEGEKKFKLKGEEITRKKRKDERPERGIETLFRVTLTNHIKLSDIADAKANNLIAVCAITLSVTLSTLFPKLDKADNYYLIYPTILFLLVSTVTMTLLILSTRPKVTSESFTKEDVKKRRVNLLFFGNFNKMSLENFQDGMADLMGDRDYLYKSLMKDLYFLGAVLEKKYKILRTAYTFFMYGMLVSVLTFIISFMLMKSVEI
jgi:HD superfamily phosphodiesterase